MQMRYFIAHFMRYCFAYLVCSVILVVSALMLLTLCHSRILGPLAALFYFGIVMPFSIKMGMAIHPLDYRGLMIVGGVQFIVITLLAAQFARAFRGVYGMGLQWPDLIESLVVAGVIMVPLIAAQCAWLYILRRQSNSKYHTPQY